MTEADLAKPLMVGITYNLKKNENELSDEEAEFDDISTVEAIKDALIGSGYNVSLFEVSEDLIEKLTKARPDIVFNIAEGVKGRGRESQIPAILNFLGIPFTGSDEATMCLTLDKNIAKIVVASGGIKTPKWKVVTEPDTECINDIRFPVIVKPNAEGSSKGITKQSIATDRKQLKEILVDSIRKYDQPMIVEEYINGREFTVGILGNGKERYVFPAMEIVFRDKEYPIYGYDVKRDFKKYVDYTTEPKDINGDVLAKLNHIAGEIFEMFGCNDCARLDFRIDKDNEIYFIEINPLPGLALKYSDFPMLAEFNGVEHPELICRILRSALKRYSLGDAK